MSKASVMDRHADSVLIVGFYEWAKEAADGLSDEKIAGRIGVTGKTVGRWKDHDPSARDVIEFAKKFERSIPEALRNAYGLSAADLQQPEMDPRMLPAPVLIADLVRRLGLRVDELYQALDDQAVISSDRQTRQTPMSGRPPKH